MSSICFFVSPRLCFCMSICSVDILETRCGLLFSCFLLNPFFSFLSYFSICLGYTAQKEKKSLLVTQQKRNTSFATQSKTITPLFMQYKKSFPYVSNRKKLSLQLHNTKEKNIPFAYTREIVLNRKIRILATQNKTYILGSRKKNLLQLYNKRQLPYLVTQY